MNKKMKIILAVILFGAFIAGAYFAYDALTDRVDMPDTPPQAAPRENLNPLERAPDFTILDSYGNEVSLSDLLGTPVVLNFWATWCPNCVAESAYFDELYREMGEAVRIVKVNLLDGMRETRERVDAYIADNNYAFPVYFDTTGATSGKYGVRFIPVTFFINADGYIVHRINGAATGDALSRGVELAKDGF